MAQDKHYDVIIIGTGAGGGTLVHTLASTGKSILILERGDYVPREKANWDSRAVNVEAKYQTKEEWRDKDGKPLHPHTNYYVGGNTKFYGAALFRLRKEDFGEIRHFGGISPAWPISYDELEPYYLKAEKLYHVHGKRGEDPTDPQASGPYPHPAISHEPRIQQLSDDFERLGLKPFHTPLGLQRDEQNLHASKCIRCDTCDGYPCLVDAKSDAQVLCVDPALRFPNVTLLTNAYVDRLETNASGNEISRVVVSRNAREKTTPQISWSSPAELSIRPLYCFAPPTTNTREGWPMAQTLSAAITWATRTPSCSRSRSVPIPRSTRNRFR